MAVIIATKNGEQAMDKQVLTVGSENGCDVKVDVPVKFVLSVELMPTGGCKVVNVQNCPYLLFKGQQMGAKIQIERACKIMIDGTDEFIGIKLQVTRQAVQAPQTQMANKAKPMPRPSQAPAASPQRRPMPQPQVPHVTMESIAAQDFDEEDIRALYGDKINAATKIKLDRKKAEIEARRVSILKDISYALDDAKKKMQSNGIAEKFLLIALIACPIIMASAISDAVKDVIAVAEAPRQAFPLHMRLLAGYAVLLFVNALILKQGSFLYLQGMLKDSKAQKTGSVAKNFMLLVSASIFLVIGGLLTYFYFQQDSTLEQGPTIVSMVSLFALLLCAICSGYFKSTLTEAVIQYDKYENREDFKAVLQEYQRWIGLYINNLSSVKLRNIKDKMFSLNLKRALEIGAGMLTAPFLAFAVSNTLAMCFPEAAGWIRISGLRLSPVFLALSTFMIIFAFFSLTNAFVEVKRVNGAEVIKSDGFENYMNHGVDLFGTEAVKKLKSDGMKSFIIALIIIIIEFSMNVSYFMQEMGGGEWWGILLSFLGALVPTSMLVAETYMLAHTQFEIYTCDEILSRLDKEIDE